MASPRFFSSALPSSGVEPTFVQLVVSEVGQVTDARVVRSSGVASLDAALVAAALKCSFTPGTRAGRPAAMKTMWIYRWIKNDNQKPTIVITPKS
jgi:TonB family protein